MEKQHASRSPRAVSPPHAESTPPSPAQARMQHAMGNQAVQDILIAARAAGRPDNSREGEADRLADAVMDPAFPVSPHLQPATARSSPPLPPKLESALNSGGQPLDPGVRALMESRFNRDFGGVRIHADNQATKSARAMNALAFAAGGHIVFRQDRFAPDTKNGRKLIAHELAHVGQQADRAWPDVQCQESGPSPGQPMCMPEPSRQYSTPPELFSYESPQDFPVEVDVEAPSLSPDPTRRSETRIERLTFHNPVLSKTRLLFYAVPRTAVGDISAQEVCVPPEVTPSLPLPSGGDAERRTDASTYYAPPRSFGITPEGPIDVVLTTAEHVVTTTYTKLAVGAGSTTVLRTPDGFVLIDAGVHQTAGRVDAAIAAATTNRLRQMIGANPIREIMISHAHLDHTALLEFLSRNFEIQSLRINALQRIDPRFQAIERGMIQGGQSFRAGVEAELRRALEGGRAEWERSQAIEPDVGTRNERFSDYVEQEVRTRLARIRPITLEVYVPSGGRLNVVPMPIGQLGLPPGTACDAAPVTLPGSEQGRAGVVDPNLAQRLDERLRRGGRDTELDRYSSSFIITLPGGNRLIVMPDLREADFARIRSNFEAEIARMGRPAQFQAWDISHHMQPGFTGHAMPASELARFTRFLHDFTAVPTIRGGPSADFAVVSVRGDPTRPAAESFVDPANVWLLRSLGMEVFLAATGRDIEILEVETSQGRRIGGVVGEAYEGGRPSDLLVRRAEAAIKSLEQSMDSLQQQQRVTDPSSPDGERIANELATAQARQQGIRQALRAYAVAVRSEIGRGLRSARPAVAPAAGATEPAFAEARALRQALIGFDQPVVGSTPRFTETALVILGRGRVAALTPLQRQMLEARERAAELRRELATSETPHRVQVDLLAKLHELRGLLEAELRGATGPTLSLLEDELATTRRQVERLTPSEGTATRARVPGMGDVAETRVVSVSRPGDRPSRFARGVQWTAESTGRVMGGVMVYQLVKGQADLEKRAASGQAGGFEYAAGTTHNALGVSIGVRMVRGIPVGGGQFIILSALDITQTAAREYDSEAQRNAAVAYSVIRNGVSLALMVAGQALMRTGHPVAVIAGMGIMFIGDPILEAIGVYDLLEQAFESAPSEVTEVSQSLRRLVPEYGVIIGAMELARRDSGELTALGTPNPQSVRDQARRAIEKHRPEAMEKEGKILKAFEKAYARARTGYAGLRELDAMRREFLNLQHLANPPGETTVTEDTRARIERAFERIEDILSLDRLSAAQIDEMEQWGSIDDKLGELHWKLYHGGEDLDWDAIREKTLEAASMIRNARYRIEPRAQGGLRTRALIAPGTEAHRAYEAALEPRERRLNHLQMLMTKAIQGTRPRPVPGATIAEEELVPEAVGEEGALQSAEQALRGYDSLLGRQPALPKDLSPKDIYRNSADAGSAYRAFVSGNKEFREGLQRMELAETNLLALISTAQRAVTAASERLRIVMSGARRSMDERRIRAFLFTQEAGTLAQQVHAAEEEELAKKLGGQTMTKPLAAGEIAALQSKQMREAGIQISTVASRLSQIPELRRTGPRGTMTGIYRIEGVFDEADFLIASVVLRTVAASENVLVGDLGFEYEAVTGRGHVDMHRVTPLNRAALRLFGGPRPQLVPKTILVSVKIEELRP